METWAQHHVTKSSWWYKMGVALGIGAVLTGGVLGLWHVLINRTPGAQPVRTVLAPPPATVNFSSGTIGLGGSLSESLQEAGLSPSQTAQIEKTLHPLFNPRSARPSDLYEVTKSTDGHFLTLRYWPSRLLYFEVVQSTSGVLSASRNAIPLVEKTLGAGGLIRGSLWEAMSSQGVPPEIIIRFAELFSWRIDFLTEPRVGDSYKVAWQRSEGNGATREEEILCAVYTSREKGELTAYPLAGEYFDAKGDSLRGEFLRAPLTYRRITSYFTERRFHPILRIYRPHHGIDYAAPYGTPASSIADGVVISKGWAGQLGNEVHVRHAGSYVSIYGHLSRFARGIHPGAHVKQGQVVGYVGSTGLSTGPHLHFGFERGGQLVNFFSLKMKNSRRQVPEASRAEFDQIKHRGWMLLSQVTSQGSPAKQLSLPSGSQ